MKKSDLLVLGLSARETEVLAYLHKNVSTQPKIAHDLGLSRSFVSNVLLRLRSRGLVKRSKLNTIFEWSVVSPEQLESTLNTVHSALYPELKQVRETGVRVYTEETVIKNVLLNAFSHAKGGRLTMIQSSHVDDGWVDLFGKGGILDLNKQLKNNEIVFDTVISDTYFDNFIALLGTEWFQAYKNRPNLTTSISGEFVASRAEVLLFQNVVYILHLQELLLVEIENKEIYRMMSGLILFIKKFGNKVNLYAK